MNPTTYGIERNGGTALRRAARAFAWTQVPADAKPMAINAMGAVVSPVLHRTTGTTPRPPEPRC